MSNAFTSDGTLIVFRSPSAFVNVTVRLARSMPSMTEKSSGTRMGEGPGGSAMGTREQTVSAQVISVDVPNNKVTFKGPKGNRKTITVSDPTLQLPNLKPGQVVQFTYTEAVAVSIRPSAK